MSTYCQYPITRFQSPICSRCTVSSDRGNENTWVRAYMRVVNTSTNIETKS